MTAAQTRALIRFYRALGLRPEMWRASSAAQLLRTWDREEVDAMYRARALVRGELVN